MLNASSILCNEIFIFGVVYPTNINNTGGFFFYFSRPAAGWKLSSCFYDTSVKKAKNSDKG